MTVLVTGGEGQLAQALRPYLPDAIYIGHGALDVSDEKEVKLWFRKIRPDVVLHTAAITNHQCQNIPLLIRTNIVGTQHIAAMAGYYNARLIYLSTHYVYPGESGNYREDAECDPIGTYAWTKYAGELAVKAATSNYLIVRGSWYTPEKLKLWSSHAVADGLTNREPIAEAARKIGKLVQSDTWGTVNIGGHTRSFYDLLLEEGYTPDPISRRELALPYAFPKNSSADTSRYRSLVGD